ncbi:MAG: YcxB family protein [Oscillospiraceae bacterium]|nr:YcxB family protein [Oscillospiraceae bacterium]
MKLSFRHSEETIRAMVAMQTKLAGGSRTGKIVYALGVLGLAGGTILVIEGYEIALMLVLLGCWAIMGVQQTPSRTAKQIVRGMKGKLPRVSYTFHDEGFDAQFDKTVDNYKYSDVAALIRDRNYLYIGLKSMVTLVIPKNSENFSGELEGFLKEKTGKKWTSRPHSSGLSANIYSLIEIINKKRS